MENLLAIFRSNDLIVMGMEFIFNSIVEIKRKEN